MFQNRWYLLAKMNDIINTLFFLLLASHGRNGNSKMAQAVVAAWCWPPLQTHVLPALMAIKVD